MTEVVAVTYLACTLSSAAKSSAILEPSGRHTGSVTRGSRYAAATYRQARLIKPKDSAYSCSVAPRPPAPGKGLGEGVNLIVVAPGKSE
jgi:hypothetical protein